MAKKVIQVPIDESLLKELNYLSKKQHKNRSELIREACIHYLSDAQYKELDRLYQRGYERIPEEQATGEMQVNLANEVLTKESW